MNAVEIEEAISGLAELPFDAQEFPFAFLQAFGNTTTIIKRLRSGTSNKSDLDGVLQTNNIHILVCAEGEVTRSLAALKANPITEKAKALVRTGKMNKKLHLPAFEPASQTRLFAGRGAAR